MTEDNNVPEPRAPGVYLDEVSTRNLNIVAAPTTTVAFVGGAERGPVGAPEVVRNLSEFSAIFGGLPGSLAAAIELFFLNGGSDAVVLRVAGRETASFARALDGRPVRKPALPVAMRSLTTSPAKLAPAAVLDASCFTAENGGFRALDGVAFNLMYIPPYRDGESVDLEVLAAAASYCGKRRAMLIIDPPREWSDTDAAVRGVGSIRNALGADAKNAMVYFPYLRRGGANTGELPPGGAVAGIIVRTDLQRGVWRSPTGLETQVRGADGAAISVSDADRDRLSLNTVNCIRPIPGTGPVVWGAHTLDGAANGGEWKYIPVRRLALLIEESLVRGLAWTAFEHNAEALWALVRQAAGSFLDELHRRGAFQGASPKDSYFVKCDRETTTPADGARGMANLVIGFAPLRPAEFIVMRVQLQTASPP